MENPEKKIADEEALRSKMKRMSWLLFSHGLYLVERIKRTCVVRYLAAEEALRLKRKRMSKNLEYEAKRRKQKEGNLLPFDVELQVLACLEVDHLFRSCLLVCKQWKDAILSSPSFARRQYSHSQRHNMWATRWKTSYSSEKSNWGSYTVLDLHLEQPGRKRYSDKGILYIRNEKEEKHIRVGNTLQNNWKLISAPSKGLYPCCMNVDSSTSPASFRIVAISWQQKDRRTPMQTEIFDSKTNTWNKGNTITLDGPFQDKLETSLVTYSHTQKSIVAYNFEQKRWSIKGYVSPVDNALEQIVFCEEEPILVSYSGPWISIWKEHSCSKGIIKWALITKLDIKIFLAQHNLKVHDEASTKHTRTRCTGYVISVTARLFGEEKRTALLTYDTRKDCWKLEGSTNGRPSDFDMRFTPSLITI